MELIEGAGLLTQCTTDHYYFWCKCNQTPTCFLSRGQTGQCSL